MMQQQPLSDLPETIKSAWQSPSNIALVKYWGKYGTQLPNNTSLSFTLENCHTQTHLQANRKQGGGYSFEVALDGKPAVDFEPKIATFFDRIKPYIGFLEDYHFTIATSNSFPHSSGIASSASGMSALALCLLSLERKMSEAPLSQADFNRKASFLARLGSGSACRSIEGPLVLWGAHPEVEGSSDEFGLRPDIDTHPDFKDFQDYILLVDKGEKQVSSSVGHGLMIDHPYAVQRFKTANDNIPRIIDAMRTGDIERFIAIVESEALQLHAMMMTSHPYFILMKPNTLEIINRIWAYRRETGLPVCFTLDAGANVHLLFPRAISQNVETFIKEQLQALCVDGSFIADHTGLGAREI
jgi:diphosphomevalonate decarboxylase